MDRRTHFLEHRHSALATRHISDTTSLFFAASYQSELSISTRDRIFLPPTNILRTITPDHQTS